MEELAFYLRITLALLFLTTGWSKTRQMGEHIGIVEDYRIMPKKLAPLFARLETYVEIALALLLLAGFWQVQAALASSALLALYTVAIVVNLLRGRTEVSCGCGGAAGNHLLSWWLVLRNLVLIGAGSVVVIVNGSLVSLDAVLAGESWTQVLPAQTLVVAAMAALTMVIWSTANLMHGMDKDMRALWERKS